MLCFTVEDRPGSNPLGPQQCSQFVRED